MQLFNNESTFGLTYPDNGYRENTIRFYENIRFYHLTQFKLRMCKVTN